MGFDAWFFWRMDQKEADLREANKEHEWIHRPTPDSFGTDYQLFTHKLKYDYGSPHGFNFDVFGSDPIFQSDKRMTTYNADEQGEKFAEYLEDYAGHFSTNQILVLMGMDFQWINAFQNYWNMDNMIEFMNKKYEGKYILKYSTPSDYVDDL